MSTSVASMRTSPPLFLMEVDIPGVGEGLEKRMEHLGMQRTLQSLDLSSFSLTLPKGLQRLYLMPCRPFMQNLEWFDRYFQRYPYKPALIDHGLCIFRVPERRDYTIVIPGATAWARGENCALCIPMSTSARPVFEFMPKTDRINVDSAVLMIEA